DLVCLLKHCWPVRDYTSCNRFLIQISSNVLLSRLRGRRSCGIEIPGSIVQEIARLHVEPNEVIRQHLLLFGQMPWEMMAAQTIPDDDILSVDAFSIYVVGSQYVVRTLSRQIRVWPYILPILRWPLVANNPHVPSRIGAVGGTFRAGNE